MSSIEEVKENEEVKQKENEKVKQEAVVEEEPDPLEEDLGGSVEEAFPRRELPANLRGPQVRVTARYLRCYHLSHPCVVIK